MAHEIYASKIIEKTQPAENVVDIKIAKPKGFSYHSGQFIQIILPNPEEAGKEIVRAYSLCSTPSDNDLELCIKLVPDGKASDFVKNKKVDDEISFRGPFGRMGNEEEGSPLHFVATGTGIAPLISIIRDELENKKNTHPMHLFFGLRSEGDIFFKEELDKLKEKYSNFDYQLTLSQPSEKWQGLKGWVTVHIPEKIEKNCHYYLCGNPNMVKDVKKILEDNGVSADHVHFETF